jgi:small-conductance mechanosensitive channel
MEDVQKAVQKAKETVERLEAELAKATDRGTALQVDRRKLAFGAHNGDDAARKKLDKLTAESVTIGLEVENLRSAIDEAKARLADAERMADLSTQRTRATQVKEIAARVQARGPTIAAAVAALCNEYGGLVEDLNEIRMLNAPIVQGRLVALGFSASVRHQLQRVGFDVGDHVPPALRYTPEHLASTYSRGAIAWADSILGDSNAEEAA